MTTTEDVNLILKTLLAILVFGFFFAITYVAITSGSRVKAEEARRKELMERNLSAHSKCVLSCQSVNVVVVGDVCYCRKEK